MTLERPECPQVPDREAAGTSAPPDWHARRTLVPLSIGNVLQAMGLQIFAPILPLYLAQRGMSPSLIGLVMGMGIAGYGLGQYPSGLMSDRFDRRRLLRWGMGLYALTFFVYLLPLSGGVIVCLRFLHASLASLYTITTVAVLVDATPVTNRGRVFGLWQATTKAGFLIGPLAGGLLGSVSLEAVFVFSGLACFASFLSMLRIPPTRAEAGGDRPRTLPRMPGRTVARLVKLMLMAAAGDYLSGTFLAFWSIWLLQHGASPVDVGVSFCFFALPGVVLSTSFGAYADGHGAKGLVAASCLAMVAIGPLCASATLMWQLHAVAFAAGLASSIARPVLNAEVSKQVGPGLQSRAQSVFFMGLMLVQLLASILGGLLLSHSAYAMFGVISIVALGSLAAVLVAYPLGPDTGHEAAEPAVA